MTNADNANDPSPVPPEELLDFLRRAAAAEEVPEDLRLKARIARESLETGELPVLSDFGSSTVTTRVRLGAGGERVFEVSVAEHLPATDDAQHAVETVAGKVPPQVLAFLRRRAAEVGAALLVELIVEVISKGQGLIPGF